MIILVLGNGFDLAHGLPTSYPDFLNFVRIYKGEGTFPDDGKHRKMKELADRIQNQTDPIAKEAYEILSKENRWLDHFLDVYEKRIKDGKDGWIDFEAEISDVIQTFDKACEHNKDAIENGARKPVLPKQTLDSISPFIFAKGRQQLADLYSYPPDFLRQFPGVYLLPELSDLTRLFEIYLTELVEKTEVSLRIPEIYYLGSKIDKVLNFNYTDTYRRLYRESDEVECCFIHGKASEDSTCNLVLGMDEFQEGSSRDRDNVSIWFKKFYQRIYKETSSDYIDWLEDDKEENEGKDEKLPLYIYFYGHSLAETDKDVLRKLIMYENAIVRIFYHKKEAMAEQIENLVKVIGEENLIHMTRGRNRKIEFWLASKPVDEKECKEMYRR